MFFSPLTYSSRSAASSPTSSTLSPRPSAPRQLGCTAEDLYAARCGLLHSGAAESKLSREKHASELWYATSLHSVPGIQAFAQRVGANAKVVYLTALLTAFSQGVVQFSDELSSDETRRRETAERIRRWLRFVPGETVTPRPIAQ
jgi:hypothetical protein